MNISVIIIARNEEKRIARTLNSLHTQKLLPDEIIVVDNASADSTAKVAKEHGATVVYESVPVRGKAWNTAFLASRGRFLAISGADWVLDPDWLRYLYQRINTSTNVGGVAGRILALNKEKLIPHLIDLSTVSPRLGNAVMMYRRKAIVEAGLWDASLHNAEDVDLAQRVLDKGYEIVYAPKARIYHAHPERLSHALKRQYEYGYWSMIARKGRRKLTKKECLLLFIFPFIIIRHLQRTKIHPLLPLFLTLTTYSYTLGMWSSLLVKGVAHAPRAR